MRDISNIDLRLVQSLDDVLDLKAWLGQQREFLGCDTETTGLNVGKDHVRLMQFGDATAGWALDFNDWRGFIKETIESYRGNVVYHNLLFDSKMLLKQGIRVPQRWAHDSMVMAHLDNPMWAQGLKPVGKRLIHPLAAEIGQGALKQAFKAGDFDWDTIPIYHPAYWTYSAFDTSLCSMVAEELWPRIQPYRKWYEVELACIHCLRDAELAGMQVDTHYCEMAAEKLAWECEVIRVKYPDVDLNSDLQTIELLRSRGVPLTHLTEKGEKLRERGASQAEYEKHLSTNKAVLTFHERNGYAFCGEIRDFRSKDRMRGSYMEKLLDLQAGGRVHCNIKPTGARTGRMSVTDPPLQTLPRGRLIRDAFVAGEGNSLVIADYASMEMRVMAAKADEQSMIDSFLRGEDLHNFVAAAAYGEGFTKKQRGTAKNAGFAKIYGAGAPKFAETAGIPLSEAEAFLNKYDILFPGVKLWQERMMDTVRTTAPGRKRTGHIMTTNGRKLPVPTDEAYKACNYDIQGSCSEVLKLKIVEMSNAGLGDFFRLPVHDEVLFECPTEHAEEVRNIVEQVMPDRTTFKIPLTIESTIVGRWGENYAGDEYPIYMPELIAA